MRSQLRVRVLLPVALLGLLGVGFGAFNFLGPSGTEDAAALASVTPAKKSAPAKKAAKPRPTPAKPTPLEFALREHRAVVVVLYTPDASLDALTTLEARAGAQAAGAGFLAVDVSNEKAVAALAKQHALRTAPGILVVTRGPKVAVRFNGYEDRETVAQAAANAVGAVGPLAPAAPDPAGTVAPAATNYVE